MAIRMQQRRGTASQWTTANPVLAAGEIGYESDTNKFKIGDGSSNWTTLDYFADINSTVNPSFGSSITFEGATEDAYETTLQVVDPTADRTVTIPDASGTIAFTSDSRFTDTRTPSAASITDAMIATTLSPSKITGTAVITTDSRLSDTRTPTDLSVTTGKIADSAVTSAKIADGTIVAGDIADGAITSAKILDGTIVAGDIADGAITSAKILDGTIVDADINNSAAIATSKISGLDTALAAKLPLAGGTMTGALTLSGAPTTDLHAATKAYVDGVTAGINFHQAVKAATTGNLSANYNNGTNGYGATLTADTNRTFTTVDGVTPWSVGDRILIKDQTTATQNGIYTLTTLGSGSTPWVLTRAIDADNNPAGELATGDFCFVTGGTVNANTGYILSTTGTITLGTTNVAYTQFNAAQAITAGTGLSKTGSTLAIDTAVTADLSTAQTLANKTLTTPVLGVATATSINGTTIPSNKTLVTTGDTGTVTSTMILDGTIATADIADSAITTAKYADLSITTVKIADSAITSAKIADATIVDADISATAAITKTKISGTAVTLADSGTVTSTMIADGTIVDGDINASAAIAKTKISGTAVTLADSATVTNTMLANNSVTVGSTAIALGTTAATVAGLTLTSPVVNTPAITLSTSSSTTDGRLAWDTTYKHGYIGNGTVATLLPTFTVNTTAKTGAYTLVAADANTLVQMNGAFAFTVPLNSSVAYPVGTQINLIALTTGVSVVFTSGITSYATPGLKLRAAGSMATLIKLGTDTWVLTGDLIA